MPNVINGSNGGEALNDTPGDDQINALGGDDTITVTLGIDTAHGGDGHDTLVIDYGGSAADVRGGLSSVFYTNLGHNMATWERSDFRGHLFAGINWVSRQRPLRSCTARRF